MKLQWHRCMSSDGGVPERKDSQQPPSLGAVRNNRGFDRADPTVEAFMVLYQRSERRVTSVSPGRKPADAIGKNVMAVKKG